MAGWKNISDYLARPHAFWTAHTARARPGPPPNRAARRGPRASPSAHAGGVRSWRTRNARAHADATQTIPRPAGFRGQNTRRDHGRATRTRTARAATRTSNGSTHGARPPAGYGGRPLATASIVQAPGHRCPIRRLLWNSRTCARCLACLVECWPTPCASFQASAESDDRSS